MFTEQQLRVLEAPLARERVKQRRGAGRQQLPYVEAWQVIEDANRTFGFGNWSRETVLLEPLHDPKLVPDARAFAVPARGHLGAQSGKLALAGWSSIDRFHGH